MVKLMDEMLTERLTDIADWLDSAGQSAHQAHLDAKRCREAAEHIREAVRQSESDTAAQKSVTELCWTMDQWEEWAAQIRGELRDIGSAWLDGNDHGTSPMMGEQVDWSTSERRKAYIAGLREREAAALRSDRVMYEAVKEFWERAYQSKLNNAIARHMRRFE